MTGLGVGPREVDEMDMREINDLMDYWVDYPPPHVALVQVRDVVITGLGGTPPSRKVAKRETTPQELAALVGLDLGAIGG